jgi:hypothetical protein
MGMTIADFRRCPQLTGNTGKRKYLGIKKEIKKRLWT